MPSKVKSSYWSPCTTSCLVCPTTVFDPHQCESEIPPTPQPDNGVPMWQSWPCVCVDVPVPCDPCESDSSCSSSSSSDSDCDDHCDDHCDCECD